MFYNKHIPPGGICFLQKAGKEERMKPIFFAVFAAVLYALNSPLSKLLLQNVPPTMMAAFLYLGAGVGLYGIGIGRKRSGKYTEELPLTRAELPYTVGMVVLDIAAPIFLMLGLERTTAENASLLNNFEIVATSLIAWVVFREKISRRLAAAISWVTLSSLILSFEDMRSFSFSVGSVFVLAACICWGFENNCTRCLSGKSPVQIVVIKGFCSGMGSLAIALLAGERIPHPTYILAAMLVGFIAYGLSICFYIYAQRDLGAAKTSTYYSVAPFIGVLLSLVIFREIPGVNFWIALVIMAGGTWLASTDGET